MPNPQHRVRTTFQTPRPRSDGSVSTWSYITSILQSEAVICSDSDDYNYDIEKDDLNTKYKAVVQSRMHLIAARPRLLPYFDMIRWALDHIDLPSRTIVNDQTGHYWDF
jgi:hypothetical protein